MRRNGCWAAAVVAVAGVIAAGCGSSGASKSSDDGQVTLYSSLPLQGGSKSATEPMVNAIKLAVQQHGGKAGKFKLKYVSLDDSNAQAGTWTPELVSQNARTAVRDKSTIAYLGEYNSGATAVSLPILNQGKVPQTGVNSAVGLTQSGPGAQPGEPAKYYPTGVRTFVRGTPSDAIQAAALATLMQQSGCQKAAIANDQDTYGAGLAGGVVRAAKGIGVNVVSNTGIEPKAPNYRGLAGKYADQGVDCFLFTGVTANNAVQVFKDVSAAVPSAKLFGDDGLPDPAFYDPKQGGLPADVSAKVLLTVPTVPPEAYPPAARAFFKAYHDAYGADPGTYAIYTYEATNLVIDAVAAAGDKGNDRAAVLKELFATKDRDSVLGKYSITATGDTTNRAEGVYGIKDAALVYKSTITARGGS
jgi:branched-chain amino acid transport system substrate-binding protein